MHKGINIRTNSWRSRTILPLLLYHLLPRCLRNLIYDLFLWFLPCLLLGSLNAWRLVPSPLNPYFITMLVVTMRSRQIQRANRGPHFCGPPLAGRFDLPPAYRRWPDANLDPGHLLPMETCVSSDDYVYLYCKHIMLCQNWAGLRPGSGTSWHVYN